jgi:hypothetical protein
MRPRKVSLDVFHADNSHYPLVKQTGSTTFSNTATTLALGSDVFKAFYGDIQNGIARQVVLTQSVVPKGTPCANQTILTLQ